MQKYRVFFLKKFRFVTDESFDIYTSKETVFVTFFSFFLFFLGAGGIEFGKVTWGVQLPHIE